MKKLLTFSMFLLSVSFGFSQNTWIHSLNGYNAESVSNSFELSGNEIFINNRSNPATGLSPIIKKINSNGEETYSQFYSGVIGQNIFDGQGNRIYSFKEFDKLIKMSNNFDTLSQISINDGGFMQLFSSNEVLIMGYNNLSTISLLDSNLNYSWVKTMTQFLPSYQSSSVTYNPAGAPFGIAKNVNGEFICLSAFEHYDSNYNLNPDSSNIIIHRINPTNGSTIDSLIIGFNSLKQANGNRESICLNTNGEVIFTLAQYDVNYALLGNEICIYNPFNNNVSYQNIPLDIQVFQGLNNQVHFLNSDSIFLLDNNFNVLNSLRLINNDYKIIKIDTLSNGYVVKIKDLTENTIKFIRLDNNFNFNSCVNNNLFQEAYSICQVTVENNNCRVIWEESGSNNIVGYGVYREDTFGSYDSLSYIPVDSLSEYLDLTSTPNQFSQKYKITYFDTCFRESPLSDFHKTIHLTANVGVNNEVNLIWTPYVGTNYNTYYIYRGSSPNNLTVLDSVSNSILSYTDFNAPIGVNLYYEIIIQPLNTCTSTKALYSSIKSNTKSTVETNSIESLSVNSYDIFPNPTDEKLHIVTNNLNNEPYTLFDIMGMKVAEGQLTESHSIISIEQLSSGSYLLFIGNNNSPRRIVKQ